MSKSSSIAEALAQARDMGGQPGEPGLESPFGQRLLQNANIAAGGYGMGGLGANIAKILAAKALPQMQALGEAGAVFPEGTPPENLPVIPPGAKTGDPHALFAYKDNFGPGMTEREIYNVFGDPAHPAIQAAGHGSSVTKDVLEKLGIPVIGKEAPRSFYQPKFR